ncbi:TMV resistance protein N-like [Punica granatum]|uniref:TMV resistance protein N-like n=1 Tax=Punica granatum TaxID=22663 RepID=A0A6P8C962_PUNGR|nr:TMV resistance protein N-like [Punica granatum]
MDPEASESDYDVFLSFRGPDTRQGFTDVLYDYMDKAGIRVFRDDDELMIGDKIEMILQAIGASQLCVPIFSETFASSKWCLREVYRMVRLKKEIVPIFYKVSPDDVKLKTPMYSKFIEEHEVKYGKKRVEKWKDALRASAQFKGREVSSKRYTEFCKEFVSEVLMKLKPRKEFDTGELIGMENQIESLMKLMDIESVDVRFIGIYGMGGIGKTTLAKIIFNKCSASFDYSSFMEDVRESSERNGLQYLEKELLGSLYQKSTTGSNFSRQLEEMFCKKKVLLVLDDIDKWEQIEKLAGKSSWFGPGSRIIITTRNIRVLTKGRTLNEKEVWPFEMETLQSQDALQLFSRYAFLRNSPPFDFTGLSEEAVSTTGGLPLSLIVMGSLLRNEEKEVWVDVIARSKQIAVKEVKERLKISFDKLDYDHQQMFLDIACFPFCNDKSKAFYMWEASRFFPTYGLEVLRSMSFIKITHNNWIWMHDQFRDLGRDIVRGESFHPRKRSRLWEHEEALKALTCKKQKKENVQGLCLDKACKVKLTQKELSTFENLRLLHLEEAKFQGDLNHLLPELRWLSWISRSKFEVSNFTVAKLVTLDLSDSSIDENWQGWSLLQRKEFESSGPQQVLKIKKDTEIPKKMILERLVLEECDNLSEIDSSIGNLICLRHLNLQDCWRLCWSQTDSKQSGKLPKSIGNLVKLESFSLRGCSSMKKLPGSSLGQLKSLYELNLSYTGIVKLPRSIGELKGLKQLDLRHSGVRKLPMSIGALSSLVSLHLTGTKIMELPSSIGGLVKLENLNLWACPEMKTLPNSLGELKSLVMLDLDGTKISELPDSIGKLGKLELLRLSGCFELKALPQSVGNLKSLIKLYLSRTSITELPESIGYLEKLQEITAEGCKLRKLPKCFGALQKLEELRVGSNDCLVRLPKGMKSLSSLKKLDVHGSRISKLPSSISRLSLLETLNLENCHQLRDLPELSSGLTELHITSKSLQQVPNLSKMSNLRKLKIGGSNDLEPSNLDAIETLTKLETLELRFGLSNRACIPSNFSRLFKLQTLVLSCRNLKYPLQLPSSLSCLVLLHVNRKTNLPRLSKLTNLLELEFEECSKDDGFENLGIEGLHSLREFRLLNCSGSLMGGLGLPENLNFLMIKQCEFLIKSPDLSGSKKVEHVVLWSCKRLTEIPGLGKLKSLEFLEIRDCSSLEKVENLSGLKDLKELVITNCDALTHIEGIDTLEFEFLKWGKSEDEEGD